MPDLEEKLARYSQPSSQTEQEKQERAERMVRQAVDDWSGFADITCRILPKGSYANNTNVRADSDVDIAVIHNGLYYHNDDDLPAKRKIQTEPIEGPHYDGSAFRSELQKALLDKFGSQCDTTGKTAITVRETSSRVSIDVVPSFWYRKYYYHWWYGVQYHEGTYTRRTDGTWIVNYPEQQLSNGRAKNQRTKRRYKHQVRILKRIENDLVESGAIQELPSYLMECLIYNVPDSKLNPTFTFGRPASTLGEALSYRPLTFGLRAALLYIHEATAPSGDATSWREPNEIKVLFGEGQPWRMSDAHQLSELALSRIGLG